MRTITMAIRIQCVRIFCLLYPLFILSKSFSWKNIPCSFFPLKHSWNKPFSTSFSLHSSVSDLSISGSGVKSVLEQYFIQNDPSRVKEVDNLLQSEKYKSKEVILFQELEQQYGNKVLTMDINALKVESEQQLNRILNYQNQSSSIIKSINYTNSSTSMPFPWFDSWYPVAFEKFTDKINPVPISILNRPYVLFFNPITNQWNMADDLCPHRFVPLSEGRINEDGCIECPYHGWSFDGKSGHCMKIPQSTSSINQELCSVQVYPVVERQGLLFMYPRPITEVGELPKPETIPLCEPLQDPDVVCLDVSRDLPYDYSTLLENILDPSHVAYTHHGTIGNRNWASEVPLLIKGSTTINGFNGTYQYVPTSGPMTKRLTNNTIIERESVFRAPMYVHHSISRPDLQSWTVVYAVPSAPGRSRIIGRFPFKFKQTEAQKKKFNIRKLIFKIVPDWLQHIQQNIVLDDDNIFLKLQEERKQSMKAEWRDYILPTRADLYVAQFRRWLEMFGHPFESVDSIISSKGKNKSLQASHSLFDSMEARLGLLDRYTQHTLHCKPCAEALNFAKKIKTWSITLAIAATPTVRLLAIIGQKLGWFKSLDSWPSIYGAIIAAMAGLTWKLCSDIEMNLIRGPWPPPRNKPLTIRKLSKT